MPKFLNPPTLSTPAARFSQAVLTGPAAQRLFISGQVGARVDGTLLEGLGPQTEQVFDNLCAALAAGGMEITDIVKLTIFCTVPGGASVVREIRNRRLASHAPASTYVQVAGLANPGYLVEIEAEALREA